jgi:hypothetical protein
MTAAGAGSTLALANTRQAASSSAPDLRTPRAAPGTVPVPRLARTSSITTSSVLTRNVPATVQAGACVRRTIHTGSPTVRMAP